MLFNFQVSLLGVLGELEMRNEGIRQPSTNSCLFLRERSLRAFSCAIPEDWPCQGRTAPRRLCGSGRVPRGTPPRFQRDIGHANRQLGAVPGCNGVDRGKRFARSSESIRCSGRRRLKSRLCFRQAILGGLRRPPASARQAPIPVRLENDVRIDQYRAAVARCPSQVYRTIDAVAMNSSARSSTASCNKSAMRRTET